MTNQQKAALAAAMLDKVDTLLEFWSEQQSQYDGLEGISFGEAREQIARWLQHLPGSVWRAGWPTIEELKSTRPKLKRMP